MMNLETRIERLERASGRERSFDDCYDLTKLTDDELIALHEDVTRFERGEPLAARSSTALERVKR